MSYQEKPKTKRDTRGISEEIVKILCELDLSATEEKEILDNTKKYLVEDYMSKKLEAEETAKMHHNSITILQSN